MNVDEFKVVVEKVLSLNNLISEERGRHESPQNRQLKAVTNSSVFFILTPKPL